MTHSENRNNQYIRHQYERLGYFLVASAFLIAVFVQLVIADTQNTLVNACTLLHLVHAVAILGMLISTLYAFMNFWLWRQRGLHVIHTFFVPGLFLLFWLFAWYEVTQEWFALPIVGGFLLGCFIFQKCREWRESKAQKRSL